MMNNGEAKSTIRSRLLEVLGDGQPHTYEELFTCFDDEMTEKRNLSLHISAMREQLRDLGQDIVCVVFNRRYYYQRVRFLLEGPTPPIAIRRGRRGTVRG
jgi:hypothetical protein